MANVIVEQLKKRKKELEAELKQVNVALGAFTVKAAPGSTAKNTAGVFGSKWKRLGLPTSTCYQLRSITPVSQKLNHRPYLSD